MSMWSVDSTYSDALFSAMNSQQGQMSTLAQNALAQGADMYTKGNYSGAIQQFKRAIALDSSTQDTVVKAENLLATVYIKQGKTQDAIKAYQSSIAMYPTDDTAHLNLGNIYFNQQDYGKAEAEYKAAYRNNPSNSTNLFSLGQVYLSTGRYREAENAFKNVIKMTPAEYGGYYALGQTYSKEGRTQDAIDQFQKVISLNKDFYNVHVDLGSAYADLGQMDKAQEQLSILQSQSSDSNLSSLLNAYIDKVTKPQMIGAYNTSGFLTSIGPGTPIVALNSSLSTPNATQQFSMKFIFSKAMDATTVQNPYDWTITKSAPGSPGGAYNWGLKPPSTDVNISPIPVSVVYDADKLTATVTFNIQQNSTATGTIDPEHIMFSFRGKDAYGNSMDTTADQYSGISKFV